MVDPEDLRCPRCGSPGISDDGELLIIKRGYNYLIQGKKQRMQCKVCGRTFYEEDAIKPRGD